MNHQTALSTQAVERYSLGELTSPQREEFEEHIFSCPDCAAALGRFETFAANARAVFEEDREPAIDRIPDLAPAAQLSWRQPIRRWFGLRTVVPVSAVAALAIALVTFRTPPAGPAFAFTLNPDERAEAAHVAVGKNISWLRPSIDLLPRPGLPNRWALYHWEIRSVPDERIVAQDNGQNGVDKLTLKIEASKFESGKEYRLIVQGDRAAPPETVQFVIDRQ